MARPFASLRCLTAIALVVALGVAVFVWQRSPRADAKDRPALTPERIAPPTALPTRADSSVTSTAEARAALSAALRLTETAQRRHEFGLLLGNWLTRDANSAWDFVATLPPGAEKTQGLLLALEAIGRIDPDRALALAASAAQTREERAIYSSLFARLAQENLPSAVERLAYVPTGASRANAIRAVVDVWTRGDLPAALTWAQNLPEPAERAIAMQAVLVELAATDPLRAIDLASKSLHGPALEESLAISFRRLTETDPESAATLVQLLPPGEPQTLATAEIARALADRDPRAALRWATTLDGSGLQSIAITGIVLNWASRDATAAAEYVRTMPAGPAQDAAAFQLAARFGAENPSRAVAWAQSLSADRVRYGALVNLASGWAQREPSAAAQWVAAQSPETFGGRADEALHASLSYWNRSDPAAARAFVENLSAEQKTWLGSRAQ